MLKRAVMIILGLGLVMILAAARWSTSPSINLSTGFEDLPIEIAHYGLFDLGIADANNDSLLDIFTSNHSGTQSLLINQGSAGFRDVFSALKLDQDRAFPGLAVLPDEPQFEDPGLYINWSGPAIVVRAYKMGDIASFSGEIKLLSPLTIEKNKGFNVTIKKGKLAKGMTQSVIEFTGKQDGYFSFKPYNHALPIHFKLDSSLSPDRIYIGPQYIHPSSLEFPINMRDRHGMAWADYNGDGMSDLYITRGGEKGLMGRMPVTFWDELLVGGSDVFEDIGQAAGLAKGGCSGRQAAWIDYNGDDRLDVYVSCGRLMEYQPNKLYEQTANGRFVEVAEKAGLDIGLEGSFVWLDADEDGDQDLFWADYQAFYLYENDSAKFTAHRLGSNPAGRLSHNLTVADFDSDGDLDIFAASPGANALCINIGGSYAIADPAQWGLPTKSAAANWVDYNNDGLQDLHAIPGGLYEQRERGRFNRISALDVTAGKLSVSRITDAQASWFDSDNNGTRDLLLALNYQIKNNRWAKWLAELNGASARLGGLKDYWDVVLVQNSNKANHWIEVQLVGSPGNRPAIGAEVTVITSDSKQVQQVGMSEGSRYSQGHYRLYFGLGEHVQSVTVRIKWPDGLSQEIKDVDYDQLLVAKRE